MCARATSLDFRAHFKLNPITFVEVLEIDILQRRTMKEDGHSGAILNESVAACGQAFDGALCHDQSRFLLSGASSPVLSVRPVVLNVTDVTAVVASDPNTGALDYC
jgi:hypothetical protein